MIILVDVDDDTNRYKTDFMDILLPFWFIYINIPAFIYVIFCSTCYILRNASKTFISVRKHIYNKWTTCTIFLPLFVDF